MKYEIEDEVPLARRLKKVVIRLTPLPDKLEFGPAGRAAKPPGKARG